MAEDWLGLERRGEMEFSVLTEAEQLIDSWLRRTGVPPPPSDDRLLHPSSSLPSLVPFHQSGIDTETRMEPSLSEPRLLLPEAPPPAPPPLDWGEGAVEEHTHTIVQGLLRKTLNINNSSNNIISDNDRGRGKRRSHDPRVTMEMRHQQVKERRRVRDQSRQVSVQQKMRRREAVREAERVVREEEREERRRTRREEALVAEQMSTIRRQVQEETAKKRNCSVGVSSRKPHPLSVLETSEREAVIVCAGESVREEAEGRRRREKEEKLERRRKETKAELVNQVEELEVTDTKRNSQLLRHCVSIWLSVVAEQRAKLRRAATLNEWRVLVRVWSVWRRYVRERRERREKDKLTRELQRERRLVSLATQHYTHQLLRRCVGVWLVIVRSEGGRRRVEEEGRRHREKVEAFLAVAASKSITVKGEEGGGEEEEGSGDVGDKMERSEGGGGVRSEGGGGVRREEKVTNQRRGSPQPIMWQTARSRVDHLLSSVSGRDCSGGEEGEGSRGGGGGGRENSKRKVVVQETYCETVRGGGGGRGGGGADSKPITYSSSSGVGRVPPHPQSRPPTKPLAMSAMQARTEAIAQRKAQREERERQREREREEKRRREEEEKKEREKAEREALAVKRREERRITKLREQERQEEVRRGRERLAVALLHHTRVLLRCRVLLPWKRFVEQMKEYEKRAEMFHRNYHLHQVVRRWRVMAATRGRAREEAADIFRHRMLRKRVWQAWQRYIEYSHYLYQLSSDCQSQLLLRSIVRGWMRVTRDGRREDWEREKRAKMHHTRQLKRGILLSWQRYLPLAREEREREVRRADLRRKVTQWLPSYQPRPFNHDSLTDF